jgi:hypothetical protein
MLEIGDRVSYVDTKGVSHIGTIEKFDRNGVATVTHPSGFEFIRINRLVWVS